MKRLLAALALTLFLIPLSCDSRVMEPNPVSTEISEAGKVPVVKGELKGPPPQIVAYWNPSAAPPTPTPPGSPCTPPGTPPASAEMLLWEIGNPSFTPIPLTPPGWTFAAPGDWSPNRKKLAFWVGRSGTLGSEIAVMDVAQSGTPDFTSFTRVTTDSDADNQPAWSPDGTKLAWSCQDYDHPQIGPRPNTAICVSEYNPVSGWSPKVKLTSDPTSGSTLYSTESGPSWNPTSDKLVYSKLLTGCAHDPLNNPQNLDICRSNDDRWDIWTYDFATGLETNETQTDSDDEEDPAWNPASPTLIAFHLYDDDDKYDVYTWNLGTPLSTATPLATDPLKSEWSPWWSKNGSQLSFTEGFTSYGHCRRSGYPRPLTDISIIGATGSGYLNLTQSPQVHDYFGRLRF